MSYTNDILIKKILRQRSSQITKDGWALGVFYDKTEGADRILDIVYSNTKDKTLLAEARKQCLISHVTAFEIFFRDQLINLIKNKIVYPNKLIEKFEKKFSLMDIKRVRDKKVEPIEIVVATYNFQSLNEIDRAFSLALNVKFFHELKEYKFKYRDDPDKYIQIPENFY